MAQESVGLTAAEHEHLQGIARRYASHRKRVHPDGISDGPNFTAFVIAQNVRDIDAGRPFRSERSLRQMYDSELSKRTGDVWADGHYVCSREILERAARHFGLAAPRFSADIPHESPHSRPRRASHLNLVWSRD